MKRPVGQGVSGTGDRGPGGGGNVQQQVITSPLLDRERRLADLQRAPDQREPIPAGSRHHSGWLEVPSRAGYTSGRNPATGDSSHRGDAEGE